MKEKAGMKRRAQFRNINTTMKGHDGRKLLSHAWDSHCVLCVTNLASQLTAGIMTAVNVLKGTLGVFFSVLGDSNSRK